MGIKEYMEWHYTNSIMTQILCCIKQECIVLHLILLFICFQHGILINKRENTNVSKSSQKDTLLHKHVELVICQSFIIRYCLCIINVGDTKTKRSKFGKT